MKTPITPLKLVAKSDETGEVFNKLPLGAVFRHIGHWYLKIKPCGNSMFNVIDLMTFETDAVGSDAWVEPYEHPQLRLNYE